MLKTFSFAEIKTISPTPLLPQMQIMTKIFIALFLLLNFITNACQCPPLLPVSQSNCKPYNLIFDGTVDSIGLCKPNGKATVFFTANKLFKGIAQQNIEVDFDCTTNCAMSFAKGDEWLIYAVYQKFNFLTVSICEHSRKQFKSIGDDFYYTASNRTFEEELQFLESSFGLQKFSDSNNLNEVEEQFRHQNTQPSAWAKLTLLLVSLVVVFILYFVLNRKK